MKHLRIVVVVLGLVLGGQASAQASNVLDLIGQACTLTRARWICQLQDIANNVNYLVSNGGKDLLNVASSIAVSWVRDAASSAGNLICVEGGQCLADYINDINRLTIEAPEKLREKLYQIGEELYLSNLQRDFAEDSGVPKNSPTDLQHLALNTNPNAAIRDIAEGARVKAYGKMLADATTNVAASEKVISAIDPQTKQPKRDPFLEHMYEVAKPPALDPTQPEGGLIAQYKSRAATSVSTREVMQTLVELQADALDTELKGTLELRNELRKLSQIRVYTNHQLSVVAQTMAFEHADDQIQLKAKLEERLNRAYQNVERASSGLGSAASTIRRMTNPNAFDGVMGGF